ncbi:amino acid adenylation domain-containing protein [Sphingomonas cannabina]|uniref:amino acid adenylation domain-containing protein n=1 Tax=Sphingomonas cannabina TaxID=2899123 RepID=UPI001F1910EC|nr:amino acid adenylation domain-containing protein [Sphingomonas cannabina]UIJ44628.1 amino acid adenylation domain-containing protein [Sphingomonas cannabina]
MKYRQLSHHAYERDDIKTPAPSTRERRLDAAFVEQAARTPERIAVLCAGQALTYRALDRRSNRLACHLRAIGVDREVRVAVALPRTAELIVALLAILKAGGAYVPLDLRQPPDRLDFLLRDSGAAILLTDAASAASLFADSGCRVETLPAATDTLSADPLEPAGDHLDLAYIIYTSGSTGVPKGVMLRHSAMGIIDWMASTMDAGDLERIAATTSITFDPSVIEIFGPLSWGGCVVLKESLLEPFRHGECPTLVQGPPSVMDGLARRGAIPETVRAINCGGEVLQAKIVERLYRLSRIERLYNHYGPTEATIVATIAPVPRGTREDPPLGEPVAGARIHLLDEAGEPVAEGEVGEICIGGDGVACGYWNRPELTGERFVPEPGTDPARPMYRTGDLAFYGAPGKLMFVGRRERQVKIRGQRVELGEIEHALRGLPLVVEAAVEWFHADGRPDRLVAFLEVEAGFDETAALRELGRWLPSHMLPHRIMPMPRLPRGVSGKVDHQALASLHPGDFPAKEDAPAGATPLEALVVAAFARGLHRHDIDVDDDFFALGGDSLSAYNLTLELEELLDRPVSPAIMAQASTPRALAQILELTDASQDGDFCVLNAGGSGRPIFCLPDVFGQPVSFTALADVLRDVRPIYGLTPAPGVERTGRLSVETLTARYLRTVRGLQATGPYCIAGYSFGGVAAFDLARALEAAGEEVTLVLIDALVGYRILEPRVWLPWLVRHGLAYARSTGVRQLLNKAMVSRWIPWMRSQPAPPSWVSARSRDLAAAMIDATRRYRIGTFGGPTMLIHAGVRDPLERLLDHDGRQGWGQALRGEVRTVTLPASHLEIMRYPHVASVAEVFSALSGEDGAPEAGRSVAYVA